MWNETRFHPFFYNSPNNYGSNYEKSLITVKIRKKWGLNDVVGDLDLQTMNAYFCTVEDIQRKANKLFKEIKRSNHENKYR